MRAAGRAAARARTRRSRRRPARASAVRMATAWTCDLLPEITALAQTIERRQPRAAGLPRDEDHQCRDRWHPPADQASQARRVRLSSQAGLPDPGTVALHPEQHQDASEMRPRARSKLKSERVRIPVTIIYECEAPH